MAAPQTITWKEAFNQNNQTETFTADLPDGSYLVRNVTKAFPALQSESMVHVQVSAPIEGAQPSGGAAGPPDGLSNIEILAMVRGGEAAGAPVLSLLSESLPEGFSDGGGGPVTMQVLEQFATASVYRGIYPVMAEGVDPGEYQIPMRLTVGGNSLDIFAGLDIGTSPPPSPYTPVQEVSLAGEYPAVNIPDGTSSTNEWLFLALGSESAAIEADTANWPEGFSDASPGEHPMTLYGTTPQGNSLLTAETAIAVDADVPHGGYLLPYKIRSGGYEWTVNRIVGVYSITSESDPDPLSLTAGNVSGVEVSGTITGFGNNDMQLTVEVADADPDLIVSPAPNGTYPDPPSVDVDGNWTFMVLVEATLAIAPGTYPVTLALTFSNPEVGPVKAEVVFDVVIS